MRILPREQLHGMEWLMDVANKMKQPTESNTSSCRVPLASHSTLIHCYGCEDILRRRLNRLDACWLTFWLEREVYVMPRQMALGFVQRANVICPTCGEHEKHFITLGFWQFFK